MESPGRHATATNGWARLGDGARWDGHAAPRDGRRYPGALAADSSAESHAVPMGPGRKWEGKEKLERREK